jgi:uncharacterized tellurite resistance protein B-like protein
MSFSDFITDAGKKIKKDHFIHLVQVAEIDGKIDKSEMEVLHKEGRKFGLTDPEIDAIIDKEKDFHYVPPYSLQEKFDEIYNIASMILADDEVSEAEKKIVRRYAIAAGLDDNTIDLVRDLVIDGIRNNVDEETLFKAFKKKILER